MHPTLFHLGSITFRSYTVLLDLGVLLALGVLIWRARRREGPLDPWLDAFSAALVLGVIGARLGYVLAHRLYYQEHLAEAWQFWRGGLSWHGALVGVAIGALLAGRWRVLPLWTLFDELALILPLMGAFSWLGCLMSGCAYGRELPFDHWLAADLPDFYGIWALRANVQLLAAGWSALVLLVLWLVGRRAAAGGGVHEAAVREPPVHDTCPRGQCEGPPLPGGVILGLGLALYGGGLALIDAWRADAVPMVSGWRLDVLLDWGLAVVGLLILLWRLSGRREREASG